MGKTLMQKPIQALERRTMFAAAPSSAVGSMRQADAELRAELVAVRAVTARDQRAIAAAVRQAGASPADAALAKRAQAAGTAAVAALVGTTRRYAAAAQAASRHSAAAGPEIARDPTSPRAGHFRAIQASDRVAVAGRMADVRTALSVADNWVIDTWNRLADAVSTPAVSAAVAAANAHRQSATATVTGTLHRIAGTFGDGASDPVAPTATGTLAGGNTYTGDTVGSVTAGSLTLISSGTLVSADTLTISAASAGVTGTLLFPTIETDAPTALINPGPSATG